MQITLTSKEMDEAVHLWLSNQGFNTSTHSISTRIIAGRSDGPLGTRVEVTLEPKPFSIPSGPIPRDLSTMDIQIATGVATNSRRFGQGSSDE